MSARPMGTPGAAGQIRGGPLPSPLHVERLQYYDECSVRTESMTAAFAVTGPLDTGRLADALRTVVGRHDSLRMRFTVAVPPRTLHGSISDIDAVTVTLAYPADAMHTEVVALEAHERGPAEVEARLIAFDQQPFDLENGVRVRLLCLELAEDQWVLALAVDHMVFDPESLSLVLTEWGAIYGALDAGLDLQLPPAPSYMDYAREQWEFLSQEEGRRRLQYWADVFRPAGAFPVSALPGLQGKTPLAGGPTISQEHVLTAATTDGITAAAAASGSTPFNLVLAAAGLALRARTGQDRIGVVTAVSNRIEPSTMGLVGLVATAVPIWLDLTGVGSLEEALEVATVASLETLDSCLPMNVSAMASDSGEFGPPGPGFLVPGSRSGGPVLEMFLDNMSEYGLALELRGLDVVPIPLMPPLVLPQGGLMIYANLDPAERLIALQYVDGGCDDAAIRLVLDDIRTLLERAVSDALASSSA